MAAAAMTMMMAATTMLVLLLTATLMVPAEARKHKRSATRGGSSSSSSSEKSVWADDDGARTKEEAITTTTTTTKRPRRDSPPSSPPPSWMSTAPVPSQMAMSERGLSRASRPSYKQNFDYRPDRLPKSPTQLEKELAERVAGPQRRRRGQRDRRQGASRTDLLGREGGNNNNWDDTGRNLVPAPGGGVGGAAAGRELGRKPGTGPDGKRWRIGSRTADCLGVEGGAAKVDACGECDGDNSTCLDCAGSPNGQARQGPCGYCCGGDSGIECGWAKDACGVCRGDNSSCADCAGTPYGDAKPDCSGVCAGTDRSCFDCLGERDGPARYDACKVCEGDNSTCMDCGGVPLGGRVADACGKCGGDNSSCSDCTGTPFGDSVRDACGVCGGDGTSCCCAETTTLLTLPPFPPLSAGGDGGGGEETTSAAYPAPPPLLCNGNGECNPEYAHCMCYPGWTGPYCDAPQNMCQPWDDCSGGRGQCDPETGFCRCQEGWMGQRCEFSTCSGGKGVYHIDTDECRCLVGYDGDRCQDCAPEVYVRWRKVGDSSAHGGFRRVRQSMHRLCMRVPDRDQEVPSGVESVRGASEAESLMLKTGAAEDLQQLRDTERAPVFVSISAPGDDMAEAWLMGGVFISGVTNEREFMRPMSVHNASGYWYDCGCRLAPQNQTASVQMEPPEFVLPAAPAPSEAPAAAAAATKPPVVPTITAAAAADDGDAADIPAEATDSDGFMERRRDSSSSSDSADDDRDKNEKLLDKETKKARMSRRVRILHMLRQATLGQFRSLTQAIMDAWDRQVDTSTAEAAVISAALNDIIDGLRYDAAFGILFTTFYWSFLIWVGGGLAAIIFCLYRFGNGGGGDGASYKKSD